MMFLQEVLSWWLVFFILGSIALPFTMRIFSGFFDKGYIFSKVIGVIVISYTAYLLGTLHITPFSTVSLITITVISALLACIFYIKQKEFLSFRWKIFLLEEVLFLLGLFFWSFIKGFQPDIHGLEKFMDYGFINSILRTWYFPAKDMWMTPLPINYYYFGHIMAAVATKLSFLPSQVTFNLMLATLFSFTFVESFSLGANIVMHIQQELKQKIRIITVLAAGIITSVLLTFGGNLHTLYTFFTPYKNEFPVPLTQLVFSPQTFPNEYWYPNATRFIYHTIHEFPIYSFVVSDLHGHVLDIPAVLLMIAILFMVFIKSFRTNRSFFISIFLLGSLAGVMYMTNAWDGLIYTGIALFVIVMKSFHKNLHQTFLSKKTISALALLLGSFIFVSLPFSFFFKPFASQIGLNCAPQFLLNLGHVGPLVFEEGYCQTSSLWQLAILYGFFFFWFVSFSAFLIREYRNQKHLLLTDLFILGLGIVGFTLIIIPEFVYLKDIYTTYFRANTMFKLVYQSFILLSIVNGYAIYRIFSTIRSSKKQILKKVIGFLYMCLGIFLMSLVLIYPYFAIMSYFNNLKNFQGLNGLPYLKTISADDYSAVTWINQHIEGQPVMLEAQGDSYTDYERISSNTGLPTVFGWMVHEWLWHGTYSIVPPRIADVKSLYESKNSEKTKNLLDKYHVAFVYIGDMERAKYPQIDEEKFAVLGKVIYSKGSVKIYKIN